MNKKISYLIIAAVVLAIAAVGFAYRQMTLPAPAPKPTPAATAADYKNISYQIDGENVQLINGSAKTLTGIGVGSETATMTNYFGNEVRGDLNGDGQKDVAFLLTQDRGGSGTFFYLVAALRTNDGYVGTNAVLLGDRIAPQTTELAGNMIVVNYADRKPNDPMSTPPSIGVSKYFIVTNTDLHEVKLSLSEAAARVIAEKSCIKGGEALGLGTYNENSQTWWFDANLNATQAGCNPACVVSADTKKAEINWRCTGLKP